MPHDKSVTTFMPDDLVEAIEEIATKQDRFLVETQQDALLSFIKRWKAGKTSRRYFGRNPVSVHKTVWMSNEVRADLARIRDVDGVGLSTVMQQAFFEYCQKQGYEVVMSLPVDYEFPEPLET